MFETFKWELADECGGPDKIPHAKLYEYINRTSNRDGIRKLSSTYRAHLKKVSETKDEDEKKAYRDSSADALSQFKVHPVVTEVRRRAKSDLAFLACYFTWETNPFCNGQDISENQISEASHGPIFNLFVQKDDSKKFKDQDTRKIRLLLWPRNGMKSSIDIVDAVQWILNFPEVRILYFTGDTDLAIKFVRETKGHFLESQKDPSLMTLYFPEFCIDESQLGNQFEFNCPVWEEKALLRGEPTVQASSINSGLGGRHYDIVKSDDAIYDRNSETEELCLTAAKKISLTVRHGKMLMHKGYFDIVGTRYHEEDYYGQIIKKNVGDLKTSGTDNWTLTENTTKGQLILVAKAIVIRPEVAKKLESEGRPVTYTEAGEEGCSLLLPEFMTYSHLMGEYADNEDTFESQLNQNPRSQGSITFDRPLLLRNTVRYDEIPYRGPRSQTWDFAGPFNAQKRGERDFCTASSAIWDDKGKCYIEEIIRNRFRPADLAKTVVAFATKWQPFVIGIEDTGGSQWLEPAIISEAHKTGNPHVIAVCSKIDWITPDNKNRAKDLRIAALHPWFVDGRLKIANYAMALVGGMEILYKEFESYPSRHDDVPDVISYQPRYAPRVQQMVIKTENTVLMSPDRAHWNILYEEGSDAFGRIGFGQPSLPLVPLQPEPDFKAETACPDYDPILGAGFPG